MWLIQNSLSELRINHLDRYMEISGHTVPISKYYKLGGQTEKREESIMALNSSDAYMHQ